MRRSFNDIFVNATFTWLLLCVVIIPSVAQTRSSYPLNIHIIGKDSSFNVQQLGLQAEFSGSAEAYGYITKIPSLLAAKGYPIASVDSIWEMPDALHISLYPGTKYTWMQLRPVDVEPEALAAAGYQQKDFNNKPLNIVQVRSLQERMLGFYEKAGYPFATVYLDSVQVTEDRIEAALKVSKGILYHVDSIRVFGKTKINKNFLQRYLGISNGSVYNKEKLQQVDRKMLELPYLTPVQSSDITMLGTGSVLNLYVQPKRSSQFNVLIGFLPSANEEKKLQVTGDVNLDLKNLLGTGETILLKWQQLQPKSPRLNIGFDQPFIFNSPVGFSFLFDLFKKDSNFIQVNAQAGLQFDLANNRSGKLFVQLQTASLLEGAIDTNTIIAQKALPLNTDVNASNVGFNYELAGTNYRFNPRTGNEISLTTSVGIKKIKPNNTITNIKDPSFNYASLYDSIKLKSYQLRLKLSAAHYFSIGKSATVKTAVNGGYYNSPSIFRNELFQIGGYRLLRGFDEESIYATRYAVGTLEYRYLIGLNSYLFGFTDAAWVKNQYQHVNINNRFIGGGLGILFETRAGLLNLSFAVGKRNDVKFNLREASKIHFGYINYF